MGRRVGATCRFVARVAARILLGARTFARSGAVHPRALSGDSLSGAKRPAEAMKDRKGARFDKGGDAPTWSTRPSSQSTHEFLTRTR